MSTTLGYFDANDVFRADYWCEFRVTNGTLELVRIDDNDNVVLTLPLCRDIDNATNVAFGSDYRIHTVAGARKYELQFEKGLCHRLALARVPRSFSVCH